MKILISIVWFLVFTKLLVFWVWLWQLKEYHFGRFKAHFEKQAIKKIMSGWWRIKIPKLTKKTLAIIVYSLLLEFVIAVYLLTLPDWLFIVLFVMLLILAPVISSLIILMFQGPVIAWQNRLLKKALEKRLQFKNLVVIAITGSYGKTSTKEFLAKILEGKFKVLKTESHINSEVGISQTIINKLTTEHQVFVCEVGAYEIGKIKQICNVLLPKIGILTGINQQHMSCFGSQENIIKAKYELIESLDSNDIAIFNGQNKFCQNLYEKTAVPKKITNNESFNNNLLPWDQENLKLAVAAAKELGMAEQEIVEAIKKLKSPIQVTAGINNANVIDSTYSANPHSVLAHLDYLKSQPNKKILIMPCLIELGKSAKQVHQQIGERVKQVCDFAIITTKDYYQEMANEKTVLLEKPSQIIKKITEFVKPNDTILLESRIPKKVINAIKKG